MGGASPLEVSLEVTAMDVGRTATRPRGLDQGRALFLPTGF